MVFFPLITNHAPLVLAAVAHHGPFNSVTRLWRATHVRTATLKALAGADAFGSLGLDRQRSLWEIGKLRDEALPMFDELEIEEQDASLPLVSPINRVIHDYSATGFSLKAHPLQFARAQLERHNITPAGKLADESLWPHGRTVAVAGLVLVRQRPGTAGGILFMTIEDETGIANLVIRPPIYETYRIAMRHSVSIVAWGRVERQGQVVHVLVHKAQNLMEITIKAEGIGANSQDFH